MIAAIRDLVLSFNDESGLPGNSFAATVSILIAVFGEPSAAVFSKYIDATDGRFYLKAETGNDCWRDILAAAQGI